MIHIAKPLIGHKEISAVNEVLKSGIIAQGPKVGQFEHEFAEYIGTDYAVAVNSGTSALYTSLLAHNIGKGDEVITTPFSFIATANMILAVGAVPVFADIVDDSFNISPDSILENITPKTRAIIPVHLYGHPARMDEIMKIADDRDISVIEDACQAHGAVYHGRKAGAISTGTFSFYPTKNMTTSEGGMVTTNDKTVADKIKMIRNHGSNEQYIHEIFGDNLRMTDIAAAIGIEQLKKLDGFNKARQENARVLNKLLQGIDGIITPSTSENNIHVFHQYTIRVTRQFPITRDELRVHLTEKGIGTGVYYPVPIPKQPFYQTLGYTSTIPVAQRAASEVLSLPVHPGLTEDDVLTIAAAIQNAH
ncbi:MAG: DegT/DnrJ/EryC1/StrS family aminotransferase [Methanosarcinales archaeon]|nr:DegT/DnrJ/EryC1/StrS family aminotransferase [Methanosarcinales archaeon]